MRTKENSADLVIKSSENGLIIRQSDCNGYSSKSSYVFNDFEEACEHIKEHFVEKSRD